MSQVVKIRSLRPRQPFNSAGVREPVDWIFVNGRAIIELSKAKYYAYLVANAEKSK